MSQATVASDDERGDCSLSDAACDWIERFARFGFATKGIAYLVIGALAAWAAVWGGVQASGQSEVFEQIGRQPFGWLLLGIAAVGFGCYSGWRLLQAIFGPDRKGEERHGPMVRLGYATSGVVHLGLTYTLVTIILRIRSMAGDEPAREWTRWSLGLPLGSWLVGAAGLVVVGIGLNQFRRAYQWKFMRDYDRRDLPRMARRPLLRIGQLGFAARGVTFCIIGGFLVVAALEFDPSEVKDVGGALQVLAAQPYGQLMLAIVSAGFMAFGVYCCSHAWCGRFQADEVLDQ
jgi:hypothetical protein